tara:strand:+ start:1201 stop:2007 length:807 start_codon:yes stop_codon:yes gene_type:complete
MTVGFNYLGKLGQLGNQMFQYATTLGVARYTGVTFVIPNHKELVVDALGNRLRIELFDCFDIKPDNIGTLKTEYNLSEKGFEFDTTILNSSRECDYNLYGFFQTEKYFKHCAREIREEQFVFKKQIVDECKEIVDECFNEPIALHIRRGDFLINSGNHHNQSLDYYEEALKKFDADRQVVIFSDDPDWCMEQKLFADDRFIVSQAASPYHDLYMMTKCSDFIIANSTFSWWGAWLANTGKVIAPKKWFGPNNAHLNTKDLYPKEWKIL